MNNEVVYVYMIREQEKKLRELMGDAEYSAFAEEIAKGAFKAQVEGMAPGGFKDYCQSHFDEITADDYNPDSFDA